LNPETEIQAMRRAIALARPGVGRTGDNPSVGCVILGPEGIVGEGTTRRTLPFPLRERPPAVPSSW
jgi:diaminohydroxyphosphoribosylaminopyrimidine deaminase/5-amino-6-(5-phosphoribosylamino)uracil reductase